MSAMNDYFSALDRLINNKPERVPVGVRITKDAVSLEAGRKKGSIKKSRDMFSELIEAIDKARSEKKEPNHGLKKRYANIKSRMEKYRNMYEEGVAREVMLLKRVQELEDEISAFRKSKIVRIKK